jgi:hypothetical protein
MRRWAAQWIPIAALVLTVVACGDDTKAPIDASAEHMRPTDLGLVCGAPAGCFQVSSSLGGTCQERCVSIGNRPAICTGVCTNDNDCGPGASKCTEFGTSLNVCMQPGDPNQGCQADAGVDAPVADAHPG